MNNKILAVAITDYDDQKLNSLSNCKNDIENILKVLTSKYQFDDIEFLHEKVDTTRKNLFNKLKFYFSDCLSDDSVLLIFSGHGQYDETLNATYWQPSDSAHDDSSTWFNLNDLMTFIRVSKAHHISIISDSCFSGAMFQAPLRGGGIEALNKKKSRMGFSSGSIEPVSDGPKGHLSPFAKVLIDELKNNKINDCPLSTIATSVILNFDSGKNQTPTFAALSNVGHEGGVFIFKMKENAYQTPKNIDYLRQKYGSLYIPILDVHFKDFENLKIIIEKKHAAVKQQDYLEARKIKDKEEEIRANFPKTLRSIFISENKNIIIPQKNQEIIKKYDDKIINFKKQIPKIKDRLKKELSKLKEEHHNQIYIGSHIYNIENIDETIDLIIKQQETNEKEYKEYFSSHREDFIKHYNNSLADLYSYFLKIKGSSISKYLIKKEDELLNILENIYDSEINFLLTSSIDEVEFLIKIKNNELKLLQWIQDRNNINLEFHL